MRAIFLIALLFGFSIGCLSLPDSPKVSSIGKKHDKTKEKHDKTKEKPKPEPTTPREDMDKTFSLLNYVWVGGAVVGLCLFAASFFVPVPKWKGNLFKGGICLPVVSLCCAILQFVFKTIVLLMIKVFIALTIIAIIAGVIWAIWYFKGRMAEQMRHKKKLVQGINLIHNHIDQKTVLETKVKLTELYADEDALEKDIQVLRDELNTKVT